MTSKNDIFLSSWKALPPGHLSIKPPPPLPLTLDGSPESSGLVPPPTPVPQPDSGIIAQPSVLSRSKTTGSQWRPRSSKVSRDLIYTDPLQDDTHNTPYTTSPTQSHFSPMPSPSSSTFQGQDSPTRQSKTGSFFDTSPKKYQFPDSLHDSSGPTAVSHHHNWHNHHHPRRSLDHLYPPPYHFEGNARSIRTSAISATQTSGSTASDATTTSLGSSLDSHYNPLLTKPLPSIASAFSSTSASNQEEIGGSRSPNLELRCFPDHEGTFQIGSGRYSKVYLGSYRKGKGKIVEQGDGWSICAVKVLDPDQESRMLGMREVWFLQYLEAARMADQKGADGARYITRLIGVVEDIDPKIDSRTVVQQKSHPSLDNAAIQIVRHSRHVSADQGILSTRHLEDERLHSFMHAQPSPTSLRLVLEYSDMTLSELIHSHGTALTKGLHSKIALQLAQAVSFLHSNHILHTDIKPHNVLLRLCPEPEVRLADFNTSVLVPPERTDAFLDPVGLGTPTYSAPEFNRPPPSPFSYPSDIWALGVSLMVAITGREPYERMTSSRGFRKHELKLWLRRGGYWAWEERERLEEFKVLDDPNDDEAVDDAEKKKQKRLGVDVVTRLLENEEVAQRWLADRWDRLNAIRPARKGIVDRKTDAGYEDGTNALYYLGEGEDGQRTRVPENVYNLLKQMVRGDAEGRPSAKEVVEALL